MLYLQATTFPGREVCTVTEGVMNWFCRINIVKFWKARPRPRTYIFLRRVALEQRSTGWIHTESVISCSNCLHSSDGESPWNSHILIFSIPRPCIIMETFHWSNGEIKRILNIVLQQKNSERWNALSYDSVTRKCFQPSSIGFKHNCFSTKV